MRLARSSGGCFQKFRKSAANWFSVSGLMLPAFSLSPSAMPALSLTLISPSLIPPSSLSMTASFLFSLPAETLGTSANHASNSPKVASSGFRPLGAKTLMPLSGCRLCDAVMTMPATPCDLAACSIAGVVATPSHSADTPASAKPAMIPAASRGQESLVSQPTRCFAVRPSASCGVAYCYSVFVAQLIGHMAPECRRCRSCVSWKYPPLKWSPEISKNLLECGSYLGSRHQCF